MCAVPTLRPQEAVLTAVVLTTQNRPPNTHRGAEACSRSPAFSQSSCKLRSPGASPGASPRAHSGSRMSDCSRSVTCTSIPPSPYVWRGGGSSLTSRILGEPFIKLGNRVFKHADFPPMRGPRPKNHEGLTLTDCSCCRRHLCPSV